jgi:hypothetical protein
MVLVVLHDGVDLIVDSSPPINGADLVVSH